MLEIKDGTVRGTTIRLGNSKREYINRCVDILRKNGYDEISMPILQFQNTFKGKIGEENNHMMYNLTDASSRELCLAPEYTAVVQSLSQKAFKYKTDVRLFYIQECFRGERPQYGRWRQFTQLGVEIINPTGTIGGFSTLQHLIFVAEALISQVTPNYVTKNGVSRGLDYYMEGSGFEVHCPELGTAQQVCGGGVYLGGMGFALGIDRLMLIKDNK